MKKIVLAVLTATLLLSGCGGKQTQKTQQQEQQQTTQANTENGTANKASQEEGVFYLASVAQSDSSNKMQAVWRDRGNLQQVLTFRSLFLADSTLKNVQPDLAASYTVSDDQLVYTITMKDNIKWSDGQPITAGDVKFSIQDALKGTQVNSIYLTAFNKIEGAGAWKDGSADEISGIKINGRDVTITLVEPFGNFIPVLAQFALYPEHCLKDADPLTLHNNAFWQNPVCSGMYHVTEFNPGNYYIMEPNPYYEGQAPKIKKIQVNFVSSYVTAAQSGMLDYYNTNAPDEVNEISKLPGYTKNPVNTMFYRYFVCNVGDADGHENPVMANPKVREALLYAIDRKTLADSLFPGLANVINTGVLPDTEAYDSSDQTYDYNPEKAKELLKEANFDFSKPFRIRYYYSDQSTIDFMEAIAYYLNEVGMKCDVQKFQSDATTELYKTREYEIAYKGLSAFDIGEWYGEYSSDNSNFANIFDGDTSFDQLYQEYLSTSDLNKQNGILKQLQKLEQEKLYKLPLFTLKNQIFINTGRVKVPEGVKFGNPWYLYDLKFADWEMVK